MMRNRPHGQLLILATSAWLFATAPSFAQPPPASGGGDPIGSATSCSEGESPVVLGGVWACSTSGAPEACADGAIAHFDSTSGVTSDVNGVSSFVEKCGNGHDAVQANSTFKPALTTVNSVEVIDCSGGDNFLEDATFPDFPDKITMLFSGRLNSAATAGPVAVTQSGTVNTGAAPFHDNGSNTTRARAPDNTGVDDATVASASFPASQVWGLTWDGSATETKLFVGGIRVSTNSTAGSVFSGVINNIQICRLGSTGLGSLDGWIREIIIWDRTLTEGEVSAQSAAMASRLPI